MDVNWVKRTYGRIPLPPQPEPHVDIQATRRTAERVMQRCLERSRGGLAVDDFWDEAGPALRGIIDGADPWPHYYRFLASVAVCGKSGYGH